MLLLLSMALGLIVYPFAANYLFENRAASVVSAAKQAVQRAGDAVWKEALLEAENYNRVLSSGHIRIKDPFEEEEPEGASEYASLVCMTEEGVMGFIEIPSLGLTLPIYHGTSERVLEMGVGHLWGTSLPVGGEGTHAVLTGHSGLSSAKLFTDLAELVEGDIFFLNVLGERLAYEVNQIKTVLPAELEDLYVESGKDYCTLVTCTPYGVNTHRLLVRGERTDYQESTADPQVFQKKDVESKWMQEYKRALLAGAGCFGGLSGLLFLKRRLKEWA